MAKKPKAQASKSQTAKPERTRDLEALALFFLAASVFVGVALYAPTRFTGNYGALLQGILYGNVGLTSWLLPPLLATVGIMFLLSKPFRPYLRGFGLTVLALGVALPLFALLRSDLGGWLGQQSLALLQQNMGQAGLLVPLLLLLFIADIALRRYPGYLLLSALRRVALAVSRLAGGYRRSSLSGRLLAEAKTLAERYPDHKALHKLEQELRDYRKSPRDDATLEGYAQLLDGFVLERSQELSRLVAQEVRNLRGALDRLVQSLAMPISPGSDLQRALEERRAALVLEGQTLLTQTNTLSRTATESSSVLAKGVRLRALLVAWEEHHRRLASWESIASLLSDLESRTDAWLRWAEWLESTPPEAHPAGLRLLLAQGLSVVPPRWVQAPPTPPLPEPETVPTTPDFDLDVVFPEPEPLPPPTPVPLPVPAKTSKTKEPPLPPDHSGLQRPDPSLLDPPETPKYDPKALELATRRLADTIDAALQSFAVEAKVVGWARGPTVTRFELEPAPGEKISRVANLSNDLARALAAGSVRIEAPIPGKSVIGLEVPNLERELVRYSEAVSHPNFVRSRERLPLVLGKSIEGEVWVRDLARMPHLLIAGSTGSGKSVAINTLIGSLLFKFLPTELRFLMIDPKMVELTPYEGIPHLVRPVVTNPADAAGVLLGAVAHMERRYKMMSQVGARNLEQFNEKMLQAGEAPLPYLVIVIDELADLMITSPKEVEQAILRLAQMARATGMHLILATQRPSVDILTSLIKVNVPARMAFAVSSGFDSRTILDTVGAERLVGQGDMLFHQPGLPKPVRLQGPFLSEPEVHRIAQFLRQQSFDDAFVERYGSDFEGLPLASSEGPGAGNIDFGDPLLKRAAEIVIEEGEGSVSRLQRRLSVGHARAGKLIDALEAMGIVGPHRGSKSRDVLIARDQLGEFFGRDAN